VQWDAARLDEGAAYEALRDEAAAMAVSREAA